MPEALETLQQIATASDSSMLNPLYKDAEGPSLAFLTDLLTQPFGRAWWLHREHHPLGAVWYQCHSGCAEIIDLRVKGDERRAGVATRLLRASFEALDDVDKVTLEVRAGNTAARALYERIGFQTVGHRAEYYSTSQGREDALLMSVLLHETRSAAFGSER